MARIPQYHRCIGSAAERELFFDPSSDLPHSWLARGRWQPGHAMHTFTDDYRQEFFWRRPNEGLIVAIAAGVCTAPDYTVWLDDPPELGRYQAWRSATVATFWQRHGVSVVPVVQFGTGIERYVRPGSLWAIRGDLDDGWMGRLRRFVKKSHAGGLLVFGRHIGDEVGGVAVRNVPLYSRKCRAAQKEGQ